MRRHPAVSIVALALTSSASGPGVAVAQERAATADLEVRRHSAAWRCPSGATFHEHIDAIAGRSAIVLDESIRADVHLVVTFAPGPQGGLVATLDATGARSGTRAFEDAGLDCTALAEAVAVSAALLLDAGWQAPPLPAPAPVPEAAAPAPVPNTVPPAVAPLPPAPAFIPWQPPPSDDTASARSAVKLGGDTWALDGWGGFTTALRESGGLGFGAMGRRRSGPASVGVGASFVAPSEVSAFGAGTVDAYALGAAVEGCLEVLVVDIATTVSPCATSALRTVVASGDYQRDGTGAQPMLGLGGALTIASRVAGPVSVLARGSALGEVVRPTFQVEDDGDADPDTVGDAYQPPILGVEVGLGVRVEAP